MKFVDRVVRRDPGESVEYTAFISIWSLLPNFLTAAFFFILSVMSLMKLDAMGMSQITLPAMIGFSVIGLLVLAHAIAVFYSTEIAITNKQIITKPGIIARNGTTLLLSKCESCSLKQSAVGRMLDYGSIVISGAGETNAVIPGISQPMEFQDVYAEFHRQATNPA